MNTFKKLMFGLLLSGMAFTAACGDTTGDKIKEGQACKKEDTCDGKLKCVVKDEKDTKGTCQKVCTKATETADCGQGKTCDMQVKTLDKKGALQCKAAPAPGGKGLGVGGTGCKTTSENKAEKCKDGLVCVTVTGMPKSICATQCQTVAAPSSECSPDKGGPDCVAGAVTEGGTAGQDDVNVCYTKPPVVGTVAVGGTCVEGSEKGNEKCVPTATCLDTKCFHKCTTPADTSDECSSAKSGLDTQIAAPKCAEISTDVKVCVAAAANTPGTGAVSADCNPLSAVDAERCTGTAVCHNAKCFQKCDTLGDTSADCTTAKSGTDGTTAAPKCAEEGGVKMCVAP